MSKHVTLLGVALLSALTACAGDSPTAASDGPSANRSLVITQGLPAPARPAAKRPSLSSAAAAVTSALGGSVTTPVSLKPETCEPDGQAVTVTYTVTGRQDHPASFQVNTRWVFNGTSWTGSVPTTVNVATRPTGPGSDTYMVTLTLVNSSSTATGTSSFSVVPFNLVTSAPAALGISGGNITVFVAFAACPVVNTAPALTLPSDFTVEATSSAGAAVNYTVTASDLEQGDLTASVVCTPASGTTFALGETTVNCSVTDAGGLSAMGSFKVTVVDTTPAFFTAFPTGTLTLIAADITGAVLDIDALHIEVEDVGHVSEPSTFSCDYVAGTKLAIGSTTTVSCTATDHVGNESDPSTFDVFVGLNVNATGFLPPLRMVAPFSAHKRGSTIPHKFLPPTYADGTPATDLASGLRLVLTQVDGSPDPTSIDGDDYSAGSTAWRYDGDAGQYIFNLKTGTADPWVAGTWTTTVSYAGITLATTQLELRR
ncbi:MAG TPA: HYR domain-containing protein [Gemmatimonadales bacterium]|nr:HYR domain-containing protein [Gemmatimonadales bacterium]